MRSTVNRHRLVRAATAAASVALLAACGTQPAPASSAAPTPTASASLPSPYVAGAVLISDGTNVVTIGQQKVTFPTTVTDASWSPDGSRIVFVDADNNISTARPDGSDRLVLTTAKPGLTRARPAFVWSQVYFDERTGSHPWSVKAVAANGSGGAHGAGEYDPPNGYFEAYTGAGQTLGGSGYTGSFKPGPARELAFVAGSGAAAEVYVADTNGRTPYAEKVAKGSEPALSPDGTKVAFVANGQIEVAVTTDQVPHPVPVTFGAKSPSHLAWSADGSRLAFSTPTDVESVSASVKAGAKANPTTQLSATTGVASFEPPGVDTVSRLAGSDPVALSIAASQVMYPTEKQYSPSQSGIPAYDATLVATGSPALALARQSYGGPVLFTAGNELDPRTKAELKRVFGTADPTYRPTVMIIGDTSVISTSTENAVRALGYDTQRLPAYDLASQASADLTLPFYGDVVVVSADDLSGQALAHTLQVGPQGSIILVASGGALPAKAEVFLNHLPATAKLYALDAGAQTALAASWSGKKAGFTSKLVPGVEPALTAFGGDELGLVLVNGSSAADVVVGINYARRHGMAAIVVDPRQGIDPGALAWCGRSSTSIDQVVIVDSAGTLGQDLDGQVGAAVAGPLGNTSSALAKLG